MEKNRVVLYGLGPIGCAIGRLVLKRGMDIVGAVDINPEIAGADLGDVLGAERIGITVQKSINDVEKEADIAVVATSSKIKEIKSQLFEIASKGINIISTCEELVYPWEIHREDAEEIDQSARKHNITVLSTGINPGFLMDFLPAVVSGVCEDVEYVKIGRVQDAYYRRLPFQRKIGVGLTESEFEERVKSGLFGHVGLQESISMLASALSRRLDGMEETIEPVLARKEINLKELHVPAGRVAGLRQRAVGFIGGEPFIVLDFIAAVAQEDPHDSIYIKGTPEVNMKVENGINGDISTAAVVVNTIKSVIRAEAGLKSMIDICPVSYG